MLFPEPRKSEVYLDNQAFSLDTERQEDLKF